MKDNKDNNGIKKKPANQGLPKADPIEGDQMSETFETSEISEATEADNELFDIDDQLIELIDAADDNDSGSEKIDGSEAVDGKWDPIELEFAEQSIMSQEPVGDEPVKDEAIAEDSDVGGEAQADEERDAAGGEKDFDDKEELSIVGIRFEPTGKTYDYLQNNVELRLGDWCIVEMEKGEEITRVFRLSSSNRKKQGGRKPLRKIMRKATHQDLEQARRNEEMGKKAQVACQKKIIERGLPMKLIKVKYSFDGSKAVFYFTAEGRIDFRDLVKDLAVRFKTRIEMRQIGVRDEARMISGFGCCGRQLCCSLFLRDFEPVSIRMAKDQCLTLNPGKISGICGRLMCCLVYEAAIYEEVRKKLPKLGERVLVNNEEGKVVSFDILKGMVFVEFPDGRVLKVAGSGLQRIKGEQQKKPSKKSPKQDSGKQGH